MTYLPIVSLQVFSDVLMHKLHAALRTCLRQLFVGCSWLKDMMRPITSSIDGGETSSAEDGVSRPTPLPSKQLVAGAAYLACSLTAQVAYTRLRRFASSNVWLLA